MGEVCKFEFHEEISSEFIEEQISSAIGTAEDIFGQPKVRLSASYLVSKSKAVIDVSNEVGDCIARIFTGLMNRKIGEKKFIVDRVPKE